MGPLNDFFSPVSGLLFLILGVLILGLAAVLIVLFLRYTKLKGRLDAFTKGRNAASLEEELRSVMEDNKRVKIQLKNNVDDVVRINENLRSAYRKIGVVRYNAFPGMAGKVSSSVCLLNNENNGIIISAIHGQEGCYTYIREIMNGKSVSALTREDEEALKEALGTEF